MIHYFVMILLLMINFLEYVLSFLIILQIISLRNGISMDFYGNFTII